MTEWTVQPDGTVVPNPATRAYQQHTVDDTMLAMYKGNPRDILEDSARQVLTAMANHLISPLLSTGKAPLAANPFKSGTISPVTQDSNRGGKLKSHSKAVCAECGGSGEYISQITQKKSNCSLGCKRPTK